MSAIIETRRLSMDPLCVDRDEGFVLELLNEPGFLENIGDRQVRDLVGARGYIETGPVQSYAANGFGLWRVTARETGEAVGICGLVKREALDDPDVGYAFLARFSGRGYASEAAAATLSHARNVLGLAKVVAITAPGNAASIAVLLKIGMKAAGAIHLPKAGGDSAYFTT